MNNHANKSTIAKICARHDDRPDTLLEVLHEVQDTFGFLSQDALIQIADILNISRADIHGVVSFYDDFRRDAQDGPHIKICRAEACQAVGGETLAAQAQAAGIEAHDVYCLGNCALGPAVMIDDKLYGRVDAHKLKLLLKEKIS